MADASLTARQREILSHIEEYQRAHGYPPTRAEIARHFGFRSANAAEQHLRALARKGALELMPGASRGLRLAADATDSAGLPIVGRVAAGHPILAAENFEGHCPVSAELFKPRADYLLRVHGESMRDAGILDGDLLAVRKTDAAQDGDIVVARIEDEVTVKRLRRARNSRHLQLLPANAEFRPIEVDLATTVFAIEGIAVGLLRGSSMKGSR
ncbi:MAG TPA: transcriptional repressor LexA [Porticoccaceae bacterium]|nr:transcriptional repressor LexA [Porticoccaceae bacterium]